MRVKTYRCHQCERAGFLHPVDTLCPWCGANLKSTRVEKIENELLANFFNTMIKYRNLMVGQVTVVEMYSKGKVSNRTIEAIAHLELTLLKLLPEKFGL